jgi:hypothetical protein
MKKTVRIKLEGTREKGLRPSAVDIRTVAALLSYVYQIAHAYGLRDEPRQPLVALSGVFEGSAGYAFETSPQVYSILESVIGFLENKETDIDPKAYNALLQIQDKILRKNGYELTLIAEDSDSDGDVKTSTISPDVPLPDLMNPAYVTGMTTLVGTCFNSGGKSPRLDFQPDGLTQTFHLEVPLNVAKEAGRRLYERVAIRGIATWDSRNWNLIRFKFDSLTSYQKSDLREGLRKLGKIIGNDIQKIGDSAEWVEKVRNG